MGAPSRSPASGTRCARRLCDLAWLNRGSWNPRAQRDSRTWGPLAWRHMEYAPGGPPPRGGRRARLATRSVGVARTGGHDFPLPLTSLPASFSRFSQSCVPRLLCTYIRRLRPRAQRSGTLLVRQTGRPAGVVWPVPEGCTNPNPTQETFVFSPNKRGTTPSGRGPKPHSEAVSCCQQETASEWDIYIYIHTNTQ